MKRITNRNSNKAMILVYLLLFITALGCARARSQDYSGQLRWEFWLRNWKFIDLFSHFEFWEHKYFLFLCFRILSFARKTFFYFVSKLEEKITKVWTAVYTSGLYACRTDSGIRLGLLLKQMGLILMPYRWEEYKSLNRSRSSKGYGYLWNINIP